MPVRQVRDRVFVLKTTRYGDADLIVNCLSSRGALLALFARSALKSKRRFGGGVLEPTHYIDILYSDKNSGSRGDSRLSVLSEASLIEGFSGLRADYSRIETALSMVGLVSEVIREGDYEDDELFNLLGNALRAAETSVHLTRLLIHFEAKLLAHQGMLPVHEPAERDVLATPISHHDKIDWNDDDWNRLRSRLTPIFSEYLPAKHGR